MKMRLISILIPAFGLVTIASTAMASEATFDRTLGVNGRVTLHLATGAGNIHLTRGSDSQIHVFGRVKSGWGGNDEQVREIAAHPPIEQTGNVVRIGTNHGNWRNISIDYEVQAPANAFLDVSSGSGNVVDDGVGEDSRLTTGSGNIHATGLQGGITLEDGSGNIFAEQGTPGDIKANTGSGTIELKNIQGGLRAEAGSGNIRVEGAPRSSWYVTVGSGDIDLSFGSAALTLDASTGSGRIQTDQQVQGSLEKHHITGKLHGGGPTVRVETGSGNIHIH